MNLPAPHLAALRFKLDYLLAEDGSNGTPSWSMDFACQTIIDIRAAFAGGRVMACASRTPTQSSVSAGDRAEQKLRSQWLPSLAFWHAFSATSSPGSLRSQPACLI